MGKRFKKELTGFAKVNESLGNDIDLKKAKNKQEIR